MIEDAATAQAYAVPVRTIVPTPVAFVPEQTTSLFRGEAVPKERLARLARR